VCDYMPNN